MANPIVDSQIADILARGDKKFRGLKLPNASFVGKDLKNADFRGATLPYADFTDCDLTYANFEGANCTGVNFTGAKCYRTNFKDANLSMAVLHAKDLYGITITLECKTFQGIKTLPGHWFGWLFYALLMDAPSKDLEDKLIQFMGAERYAVLRKMYVRRQV